MRYRTNYREGDWFAVQLMNRQYALGRVCRVSARTHTILGYFFGPLLSEPPEVGTTDALHAGDAVVIGKLGDLGLVKGEWPILGAGEAWDRLQWPIPAFGLYLDVIDRWRLRRYDDDLVMIREELVSEDVARALPRDGTSGYLAMKITLEQHFGLRASPPSERGR